MDELKKIYEIWNEEQDKYSVLKDEWGKLLETLYEYCAEKERETIMSIVLEYGVKIEQHAFIEGFKKAFRLLLDILKN